jgi:hypothetical protein
MLALLIYRLNKLAVYIAEARGMSFYVRLL